MTKTRNRKIRGLKIRGATGKTAKAANKSSSRSRVGQQQTNNDSNGSSGAKIQGFIGIIAITLGNVAAILTHVDEIRKFVSKVLGTEWAYRFHTLVVFAA